MQKPDYNVTTPPVANSSESSTPMVCAILGFVFCFGGVLAILFLESVKFAPEEMTGKDGLNQVSNGTLFLMQMAVIIIASLNGMILSMVGLKTGFAGITQIPPRRMASTCIFLAVAGPLSIVALLLYLFLFAWAS